MKAAFRLIDTHAHLCDPVFDADRKEVMARAKAAGICGIIAVGENMADAARNLALAQNDPCIFPGAGLYPTRLDIHEAEEMLGFIREHRERLAAIGEVGLDFWAVSEALNREIQQTIFSGFIDLAAELDLPLNVHSRSAGHWAISLLLSRGAKRVQLHAFDGKAASALPAVEAGYFFSIPPSVVRSPQKQKLVRQLPLSCLLFETDSPVLGPDSGQRNEPKNALLSAEMIGKLKNVGLEEVLETVWKNTQRLYGELKPLRR